MIHVELGIQVSSHMIALLHSHLAIQIHISCTTIEAKCRPVCACVCVKTLFSGCIPRVGHSSCSRSKQQWAKGPEASTSVQDKQQSSKAATEKTPREQKLKIKQCITDSMLLEKGILKGLKAYDYHSCSRSFSHLPQFAN